MNRRGFLKLLALGAVAAPIVKQLGALAIEPEAPAILTYKGVPLVWDQYCVDSRIIFICSQQLKDAYERCINGDEPAAALAYVAYVPYRNDARRGEAPVGSWASVERSRDAFWVSRVHVDGGSQRHFERSLLARSA